MISVRPGVLGVAALELLADLGVGVLPEAPQVVGDLLGPAVGASRWRSTGRGRRPRGGFRRGRTSPGCGGQHRRAAGLVGQADAAAARHLRAARAPRGRAPGLRRQESRPSRAQERRPAQLVEGARPAARAGRRARSASSSKAGSRARASFARGSAGGPGSRPPRLLVQRQRAVEAEAAACEQRLGRFARRPAPRSRRGRGPRSGALPGDHPLAAGSSSSSTPAIRRSAGSHAGSTAEARRTRASPGAAPGRRRGRGEEQLGLDRTALSSASRTPRPPTSTPAGRRLPPTRHAVGVGGEQGAQEGLFAGLARRTGAGPRPAVGAPPEDLGELVAGRRTKRAAAAPGERPPGATPARRIRGRRGVEQVGAGGAAGEVAPAAVRPAGTGRARPRSAASRAASAGGPRGVLRPADGPAADAPAGGPSRPSVGVAWPPVRVRWRRARSSRPARPRAAGPAARTSRRRRGRSHPRRRAGEPGRPGRPGRSPASRAPREPGGPQAGHRRRQPRRLAPGPAGALVGRGAETRPSSRRSRPVAGIVAQPALPPAVDHRGDALDGHRGLGDVGGEHHLAADEPGEGGVLGGSAGQVAVERHHSPRRASAARPRPAPRRCAGSRRRREEDEEVTLALASRRRTPQATRVAISPGRRPVRAGRRAGGRRGSRCSMATGGGPRCSRRPGAAQPGGERPGVEGRRHRDQLEVRRAPRVAPGAPWPGRGPAPGRRSWSSSKTTAPTPSRNGSAWRRWNRMPSVTTSSRVASPARRSKRTW
jgi:hypothetical protein